MHEQQQLSLDILLRNLTYAQLLDLQHDLTKGAPVLLQKVSGLLERLELQQRGVCASCGVGLDPDKHQVLTLVFGPTDFRQKGSFCGVDCQMSFVEKLRK